MTIRHRAPRAAIGGWALAIGAALLGLAPPAPAFAGEASGFIVFDAPGAVETFPTRINDGGMIAGHFLGADGHWHGFVRTPNGAAVAFDAPGSRDTYAYGLGPDGTIAGSFIGAGNDSYGFVRTPNGVTTVIQPTGAVNT